MHKRWLNIVAINTLNINSPRPDNQGSYGSPAKIVSDGYIVRRLIKSVSDGYIVRRLIVMAQYHSHIYLGPISWPIIYTN